jgi:protein-tyrosine phosphatase
MKEPKVRVLLVCLGNICRSPTAEGVLRLRAEKSGWGRVFEFDSAGTAAYHLGKAPDARSQRHARERGYDLSGLRARQITADDLDSFDYVLAMDSENLANIKALRPEPAKAKIALLLDYHTGKKGGDVPDPYYGGPEQFETVLDLVEAAGDEFIKAVLKKQGLFGCGC